MKLNFENDYYRKEAFENSKNQITKITILLKMHSY